jgi:hypothetical protein
MQRLRKRIHVSPATAIATLALVFAMTGGAYAAGKYLITSTKQISPKVLKALKGANGKNGAAGLAGAPGAQGPQGVAGAKGETGKEGAQGKEGVKGETGKDGVKGIQGIQGVKGEQGIQGIEGKQGVIHPGETLPSGATETGTWAIDQIPVGFEGEESVFVSASFPIPLLAGFSFSHVHVVPQGAAATGTGNLEAAESIVKGVTNGTGTFKAGAEITDTTNPAAIPAGTTITRVLKHEVSPGVFETWLRLSQEATEPHLGDSLTATVPAGCTGTVSNPAAVSGNLCVFEQEERNVSHINMGGTFTTGEVMQIVATKAAEKVMSDGTWAVTG